MVYGNSEILIAIRNIIKGPYNVTGKVRYYCEHGFRKDPGNETDVQIMRQLALLKSQRRLVSLRTFRKPKGRSKEALNYWRISVITFLVGQGMVRNLQIFRDLPTVKIQPSFKTFIDDDMMEEINEKNRQLWG